MQYPDGNREMNALNVPVGKAVKLTMASEDVIHSFSIPAFRVRHDVVPGHYDALWFRATKPGKYRIFCTEYCGDRHSQMIGYIYVRTKPITTIGPAAAAPPELSPNKASSFSPRTAAPLATCSTNKAAALF